MNTMNVNGQNGVATSANTSFSLYATSFANFGYNKKMEFTKLNKTELVRFIAQPMCMFKSKAHYCLEFGGERYCIYLHKNDKGYYVTVSETSSNTVQRPVKEVIRHYCDCFRLTEKKIDNIVNYIYDLVADYYYSFYKADIRKSEIDKEYTDNLNSPDTLNNDIKSIMEFFGNDYKALNDIENEFFDGHFDFDKKLRNNLRFKRNGTFIDMYHNDMTIINNSEYIRLTDIKTIRDFEIALYKLIETLNNDNENDETDALIGFENASEECDGNMMACVDKYGHEFIDGVIKEYADTVYNAVSDYDLDDTINYCVKGALDYMEYDPEKKRLVGCSDVPDLGNWDDEEEFCNYFEDAYSFDWDSCQEFYQTYCNDIWHFADEYDDRMEDALRDFEKESVFDKMPYTINYNNEGYINVYIDMDDFVAYIKKNMVFNADKAQLYKYNDMGIILYNMFDSDNVDVDKHFKDLNYSWLFCRDLENMLPMVTDVKLYDDGLYLWYKDITDMTIREFYELHNDGYGCTEDPINNYVDEFLRPDAVKTFFNLVEKDEDWIFYIEEDDGGDLSVLGNEGIFERYFNDDVPMVQVYSYLMDKMNKEIIKIEKEIEKEIEGAEYKVLDAFEITDAQGKNSFNVDYDEWWDYVLGETPDWIKDKYFDKFCDVLYNYFVKFAKDYDYGVEEIDGGISLEKPDYNN